MKRFTLTFLLVVTSTAAANSYLDNKQTVTHDCAKEPEAIIVGNENTITFTGTCERVSAAGNDNKLKIEAVKQLDVHGNNNTITVTAVDAISAFGNHNTVTWTKGITVKRPKVSSPGTGNKIGATK